MSMVTKDVTDNIRQLSLALSEGYENMRITCASLDIDNGFKVWCGIIHTFSLLNSLGELLRLPFVEFVKLCGISTSGSFARVRKRIEVSLGSIATNTISFTSSSGGYNVTHLVQFAKYNPRLDVITLQPDPCIFDFYCFDRKVLLPLKAINALSRKESSQVLYSFIESLHPDPAPASIGHLCSRINVTSRKIMQNVTVRKVM